MPSRQVQRRVEGLVFELFVIDRQPFVKLSCRHAGIRIKCFQCGDPRLGVPDDRGLCQRLFVFLAFLQHTHVVNSSGEIFRLEFQRTFQ